MTPRGARLVALLTAAVVATTGLALARLSLRDAEWRRRAEATLLAGDVAGAAERGLAELFRSAAHFTPPTEERVGERETAGDEARDDDAPLALWSPDGETWRALGEPSVARDRIAALFAAAAREQRDAAPVVGPVRDGHGRSLIFVRQPLPQAPGQQLALGRELEALMAGEPLTRLMKRGYAYQVREVSETSQPGALRVRSGFGTLEDPVLVPIRLLGRAWSLEVEPHDGFGDPGRAQALLAVVTLLTLIAGLAAQVLLGRQPEASPELEVLQTRVLDLSAQLDDALVDYERAEDRLRHEAHFDPGTGLPNRQGFTGAVDACQKRLRRGSELQLAVATLSFVGMTRLRDSLGREAADALLRDAAERIQADLGPDEGVARIGESELGLTLLGTTDAAAAVARIEQLEQPLLAAPFSCADQEVFVSLAAGVALSVTGFERGEQLLSEASLSVQEELSGGEGGVRVFDPATRDEAVSVLQLESRLRRAIEEEVPEPFYQPIVTSEDGRIAGMEVLVRWRSPTEGMIFPDRFIPLAEETGLVVPLDRLVLRRAVAQVALWREELPPEHPFYVSVNLSAYDLREPDVCEYIQSVLDEHGVSTNDIRLELTESAIIGNVAHMVRIVAQLRSMGFKVLLDDFGTGYSSLSYLHQFQFDVLKIDRSFVMELKNEGREWDIAHAIVSLAKALDLQVVAEGVETEEQWELLKKLGCYYCQGYYFSRPLPAHEAEELLFSSLETEKREDSA